MFWDYLCYWWVGFRQVAAISPTPGVSVMESETGDEILWAVSSLTTNRGGRLQTCFTWGRKDTSHLSCISLEEVSGHSGCCFHSIVVPHFWERTSNSTYNYFAESPYFTHRLLSTSDFGSKAWFGSKQYFLGRSFSLVGSISMAGPWGQGPSLWGGQCYMASRNSQ